MKSIYTLVFVVAALGACGKKSNNEGAGSAPPPAETGSGSAGSAAAGSGSAGSAAAAVEAPVDVPTEVDFEEQASSDITDKNVEAKLKNLEGELPQ